MGRHKAYKFVAEDFVSNMPDNVLTNILDRLPIQDAVRTCILSRSWRFNWTMLSKLVFDKNFFEYLSKTKSVKDYAGIISRLLFHVKGVVTKFVIYIDGSCDSIIVEDIISQWILLLSRKGIKDLTLEKKMHETSLTLPACLFSCLELKHLKLFNCCFDLPAGFHGFPNLLSLQLRDVEFQSGQFGEFSTESRVLQILKLGFTFPTTGKVKLVEITKHANLKILSLSFSNLDYTMMKSSSIFELVGSLPKLQKLALDFMNCKLTEDGAKKRFHTTFPSLKTLELSCVDFDDGIMLPCVFEMLRSFPNLRTLRIISSSHLSTPAVGSPKVDCGTIWLLQLRSVVFEYDEGSEYEICLVKYLLARSPFLKKIVFRPVAYPKFKEKFMFAKKLLKLHRASPVVDIDID